jgi:segregation and condensation protein A
MSDTAISDGYTVSLEEFEGPLDLLLHLVKRHELNILDIPIAFITEKYLEYVELMRQLDLDIAGEFLLMAATLCHIKSRELLPQKPEDEPDEEEDEGGDPRQELIRRLLDYQRYKVAAEQLGNRPALGRQVFPRGGEMEKVDSAEAGLAEIDIFKLVSALADAMQRSKVKLTYDVIMHRVSISDRINQIIEHLTREETIELSAIFEAEGTAEQIRNQLVSSFLAILEMAKLSMVRILQSDEGEIYISRKGEIGPLDNKLVDFD